MRTSIPKVIETYRRLYTIERCEVGMRDGTNRICERAIDPTAAPLNHRGPHCCSNPPFFTHSIFWSRLDEPHEIPT